MNKHLEPGQMRLVFDNAWEYPWRVYKSLYNPVFVAKTKEEAESWASENKIQLLSAYQKAK